MANIPRNADRWRQWLLNSAFSAALAIGGLYFNSVEAEHVRNAEETNKFRQERAVIDAEQNRQIAILQTEIKNLTSLLERMERKIDSLPERIRR